MPSEKKTSASTLPLAKWISSNPDTDYHPDCYAAARNVLLDWAAVSTAARSESAVRILADLYAQDEGPCTLVGGKRRATARDAALINGTAAHVLDYDDAIVRMSGHPAASIVSASVALAQARQASGKSLLNAIIAGYEVGGFVGGLVGPTHYTQGFHPTGTIGAIASAAACAKLVGLDAATTANALGIAATQGAGLKASFGTMAKPLHAGNAARTGLMAVEMAQRGFTGSSCILEADEGFVSTHSRDPKFDGPAPDGYRGGIIVDTLFKYHAACHFTHPALEAIAALRRTFGMTLPDVEKATISISDRQRKVCDIVQPQSGLDLKFSIRHLAAMALDGVDTSDPDVYSSANAGKAEYVDAAKRVTLVAPTDEAPHESTVTLTLRDGRTLSDRFNVNTPGRDLAEQNERLKKKAAFLLKRIIGARGVESLFESVRDMSEADSIAPLMKILATDLTEGV